MTVFDKFSEGVDTKFGKILPTLLVMTITNIAM